MVRYKNELRIGVATWICQLNKARGLKMQKNPKIFISHTHQDREIAERIRTSLNESGLESTVVLQELELDDSVWSTTRSKLGTNDYLIVLISPAALGSIWVRQEIELALSKEFSPREITVIPVKVKKSRMPSHLARLNWVDLSRDYEKGVEQLVGQIGVALRIDFDKLSPTDFEMLVADLLRACGFENVREQIFRDDVGYDLIAQYPRRDPFGRIEEETWIVEIKAHKHKTELSALRRFIGSLAMFGEPVRGLFVTSAQLSHDARAWLRRQKSPYGSRVSVMEGTDIKRLLLKKKQLAFEYFS